MITLSKHNIKKGGVDWISVGIFALLAVLGWMNIYAAVFDESGVAGFDMSQKYGSQLMWMGVCAVVAIVIMFIDDIYYHVMAYPFYAFMIVVLIATLFIGTEINGAKSWLRFGGFTVQPVEFAKIAVALALARLMSSYHFNLSSWKNVLLVFGVIAIPMVIIVMQNDTGSAVVFASFLLVFFREGLNPWVYAALGMAILVFVLSFLVTQATLLAVIIIICVLIEGFLNGHWKHKAQYLAAVALVSTTLYLLLNLAFSAQVSYYPCLLITSLLSLVLVGIYAYRNKLRNVIICCALFLGSLLFAGGVDYVFDNMLQVHQQKRILNLLGVETDVYKWGYNVNQSKIAIGSGGFFGKGYLKGTQTQYDFVPEQSTDFIFCTVGEEWGFLGSSVVLALFCLLIIRLIRMGERMQEPFGRIYCYGAASVFLFHVIVNVGMTIGIMPVIGIPLPLFSYGGSSLLAFTILFFIAVKLDSRRADAGDFGGGK